MGRDEKIDTIISLFREHGQLGVYEVKEFMKVNSNEIYPLFEILEDDDIIIKDQDTGFHYLSDLGIEFEGYVKKDQEERDTKSRGVERAQKELDLQEKKYKWMITATITNIVVGLINLTGLAITIWLAFG